MVKIVVVTKVVTHKQQTIQILHTTNQEKWPLCCRCNYCSNLIAEVEALVTAYREQARSISSIFLFFLIFSVINNQLSLFINDPCLIYLFIYFHWLQVTEGKKETRWVCSGLRAAWWPTAGPAWSLEQLRGVGLSGNTCQGVPVFCAQHMPAKITHASFSLLLSSKSRKWPPHFLTLQMNLQSKNS